MYYIILNNELNSYADYNYSEKCQFTDFITKTELDAHPNKVIVENGILIANPNYEKEEAEKEKERVGNLTCTKRVFIILLEKLGLDYFEQIQPLIEANRQARLEWELCERLERKNELLDQIGSELSITPEQLDNLFKFANGEITQEEFIPIKGMEKDTENE